MTSEVKVHPIPEEKTAAEKLLMAVRGSLASMVGPEDLTFSMDDVKIPLSGNELLLNAAKNLVEKISRQIFLETRLANTSPGPLEDGILPRDYFVLFRSSEDAPPDRDIHYECQMCGSLVRPRDKTIMDMRIHFETDHPEHLVKFNQACAWNDEARWNRLDDLGTLGLDPWTPDRVM